MNERDAKNRLIRPHFKSNVPPHLLKDCTEADKWMYEHQSIQEQQNEWLINQALGSDERQAALERKMGSLLSVRWSTVSSLFVLIVIPSALLWLGAWLAHFFERKP